MVFSSTVFLFLFLPVVLGLYFLVPKAARNTLLLIASLFFYAWGEKEYVLVMLGTIGLNYILGVLIDRFKNTPRAKLVVGIGVATNLAILVGFKYANFLADNLNRLLSFVGAPVLHLAPFHLPIGVSFFTFHAISYVVDAYRGDAPVERNPFRLGLYIALFPQLIAGPIIRYHHIAGQLAKRWVGMADFAAGVRQFIIGLSKKMLIANTLAVPADAIFALQPDQLSAGVAWMGVICYSLQLYFDFSGYSDMALGLGRMFGFHFRENFNYPYVAGSMTDFWRRWHISLSTWFRDYVYIPLGGNRVSHSRTYFNLILVFLLCGLWHGASWNFVVWGAWHGTFLVSERLGTQKFFQSTPSRRVVGHIYVLLAVMMSWVFFRAENLSSAFGYLKAMFGWAEGGVMEVHVGRYLNNLVWLALLAGAAGSIPLFPAVNSWIAAAANRSSKSGRWLQGSSSAGAVGLYLILLSLSILLLASGTHNPFIYFRF